jgi:hypothetical protein
MDAGYLAGVGLWAIPALVFGYVVVSIFCGMITDNSSDNRARARPGDHKRQEDE